MSARARVESRNSVRIITASRGVPVQGEHILDTGHAESVIIARELLRDRYYWLLRAARELRHQFVGLCIVVVKLFGSPKNRHFPKPRDPTTASNRLFSICFILTSVLHFHLRYWLGMEATQSIATTTDDLENREINAAEIHGVHRRFQRDLELDCGYA